MKTTHENKTDDVAFDPWCGTLPSRASSDDPLEAPAHWHALRESVRVTIAHEALTVLAQYASHTKPSDAAFLGHRLWDAVRDRPFVQRDLQNAGVGAVALLTAVVVKMRRAGDVEDALRARRDEIDRALAAVTKVRGQMRGAA